MGFKSIAKIVRKGSSSPPNEADPEHAQRKQQDKLQKEHDKHVAREKGKKVLPTNPEQEAEYRELNARMWRIEKDMQDARDEVMKPRESPELLLPQAFLYADPRPLARHEGECHGVPIIHVFFPARASLCPRET